VALSGPNLTAAPPAKAGKMVVVDQKDFQFIPETVAIRAGQSVKFLNSDKELHNVNAFHPRHSFNVVMPAGGEHVEKFERVSGIQRPYQLGCVYHSAMRSWVFVFDHPWYQVTGADGRFRLEGVPPGEYKLEMSHPAGQLRFSENIAVKAGQTLEVQIRVSPDNKPKKP
jgi:plastocyanin